MNNAYDVLNSRFKFSNKPYNTPTTVETVDSYENLAKIIIKYVERLEFVEYKNEQIIVTSVLKSKKKTGFFGMIMDLKIEKCNEST